MEKKICKNCKKDFIIAPDDVTFYERMGVPTPTQCPQCRLIRRLARRNERSFHRRVCEKCDKQIISVFAADPPERLASSSRAGSGIHVYCQSCWWGDSWDGLEYGVDYDPSRPFIDQLDELFHRVPMMNLYGLYTTLVNSDYTNMVGWLKNCYMVTYSDYGENLVHGSFVNHSKDSVDNLMGLNLELCYETINCSQCYKTMFSVDCESCNNVWFSKNCSSCNDCFGCVNLRGKSYHIFNEPYSKAEYEKKLAELYPDTLEKIKAMQERVEKLWSVHPQKYFHGWRNVNSSGDYLSDSKNAQDCFIGFNVEDSRFCSFATGKLTDTYDFVNFGANSSLLYECLQVGDQVSNTKFSWWVITSCQNIEYGLFCGTSSNLFGCVGLRKKEYCILNTQYSKEEYQKLRTEIIASMKRDGSYGEFFPIATSPFGYNETTAQELFPLTRDEALTKGYPWRDPEKRNYEIGGDVLACAHAGPSAGGCDHACTTAFRIHSYEAQFLERLCLPYPKLCPNCRHHRRLKFRNPMQLYKRQCAKCNAEIHTSYAPDRPEMVYCESCYQAEVL